MEKRYTVNVKIILLVFIILTFMTVFMTSCAKSENKETKVNIAIAWSNVTDSVSYKSTIVAAEETGENVVMLDMVKSADLTYGEDNLLVGAKDELGVLRPDAAMLVKENKWTNSNVEEVMDGVDCVIVPGGWDASPTLFRVEQPWHGIEGDMDCSAERDVSDYLLISYCLDKDIPIYCICRGMQMLSIVSGAEMIQDIGTYFREQGIEYDDTHRDPEKKNFQSHSVDVLSHDSLLYKTTGKDVLEGCPSWHHQMVGDTSGTKLTITAITETEGIPVIEAVERQDKSFAIGVQFHPEVAVSKHKEGADDADSFMDYDTAMSGLNAMVEFCKDPNFWMLFSDDATSGV